MRIPALIFFLFICSQKIFAQDTLPKVSVTQLGKKVLIAWVNPFNSVTVINIQRSADSLKGFTTIGSVLNVSAKNNGFVDTKEFIPALYYRVFISFDGGTYIFSQSHRPGLDTTNAISELRDAQQAPVQTWFVPSRYVYTGKESNIIIALPDAEKKKYSIKFFEDDGTPLFELKKISETYLTLDKVNFVHAGLFNFELYADGLLIEKHKVYIPKDGKPAPSLDAKGYEVR